ncbi:hypothetical protein ABZ532_22690 [Streptomyces sp. NPDC019396]|uniref:hypothetical protein n=1 Tax=Streptomyces sp. NPDC019396 TaxID=3154687 RepID=UPI0033E1AB6D
MFIALRVIGAAGGLLMLASTAGPVYAAQGGGRTAADCDSRAGFAAPGAYVLDAEMSGVGGSRGPLIGVDCGGRQQYGSLGAVQAAPQQGDGEGNPKPEQSWNQNKTWEPDEKKGGGDEKKDADKDKKQHEKPRDTKDEKKKDEGRDKRDDGGGEGDDGDDDSGSEPGSDETPYAPVRAGGGGTATSFAADGSRTGDQRGPGTTHTVVGLVLAAVAAVTIAFRGARRRRADATDKD